MGSTNEPLIRAIAFFGTGGQTRLAEELSRFFDRPVTTQRVNQWLNQGKRMPTEMALAIEIVVEGKVTAAELRPDIPANFFTTLARHKSVMNSRFECGRLAMEYPE